MNCEVLSIGPALSLTPTSSREQEGEVRPASHGHRKWNKRKTKLKRRFSLSPGRLVSEFTPASPITAFEILPGGRSVVVACSGATHPTVLRLRGACREEPAAEQTTTAAAAETPYGDDGTTLETDLSSDFRDDVTQPTAAANTAVTTTAVVTRWRPSQPTDDDDDGSIATAAAAAAEREGIGGIGAGGGGAGVGRVGSTACFEKFHNFRIFPVTVSRYLLLSVDP